MWRHVLVRGAGFPFSLLDDVFRSEAWGGALWQVAADPKFREAVTWQNRPAVANGLDALLRRPPGTQNAKTRRQQLLAAKYLQRYCAKNDTIGFFGPVGWATVGGRAHFEAGPALVAARATFFEPWAILALAREVEEEAKLKAPVGLPGDLRLEGARVVAPEAVLAVEPDEIRLLRAADGRPAAELLRGRGAKVRAGRRAALERLVSRGILRWGFPVSVSLEPDAHWRAISDSDGLAALRERRADVARAAGDPAALGAALQALEIEFEKRAKVSPRREAARHHWGRGLVYEECRRAMSMDMGSAPIKAAAPALRIVLRVARWYTFAIGARLAGALLREYRRSGRTRVPLHLFWRQTASIFDKEVPPAVETVAGILRDRWNDLWKRAALRGGQQHLDVRRAAAFVARHFPAPCPGWPGARHHAPDLMWDAPTPDALLAGAGTPILAELHPGVTPFTTLSVLSLCPVTDELKAEWEADFPERLASPVPWEEFARSSQDARLAKDHWHLDLGEDFASERAPEQVRRAADFDVVAEGGRLVAVHREGAPRLDLLRVFERRIKLRAATAFSLADGAESGPRRYLGPLLVQRAHWRVRSLPFAGASPDRMARVAAWRESLGLPERIYVRAPEAMKPIYVDLASAVSVEMLVRFARRASHLSVSEMYPGPSGLWLRDADGNSYTSEVRLIAVDPEPFDEGKVWAAGARLN